MSPPTQAYRPYLHRHQNLDGPGDERPTAIEVVKDLALVGKLSDKTILITGCSAGLGVQAARALYLTGAKLYITVRNEQKGQKAIEAIIKDAPQGRTVEMVHMDLGDFDSVRAAAKDFLSRSDRLNILINNAGVMNAPKGKTVSGFENHMGANHLGHFLFFQLLKPLLLSSSTPTQPSRVVNLSSYGHTMSPIRFDDMDFENAEYNPWVAYGQSKTANIYMANSIDRLYGSQGLHAVSVHPGVIFDTELIRHTTDDILAGLGGKGPFEKSEKSPEQGAATTVWAALTPHFDNNGGVYCADVGESVAAGENAPLGGPEYVSHAYDQKAEDRLWEFSCNAVGV
ncbi:putative short-chain dehydrogenase/reductase [Aureobasidium pullulans]|nr:putative short-chain dehydrogenase/reductase [Aureobasidium pullulans]TIA19671.1 putative short-chain dehydrogenase/reductase [Aureobasidium pullulans]